MPQYPFNSTPHERSPSPSPPPSEERSSGIFTALHPDSSPSEADSTGNTPTSRSDSLFPPDGSLDATEPFPSGLFRAPLPDDVFAGMPEMSDSALRSLLAQIRLSFRFDPEECKWVKPDRTFTRADVQAESGLSSQGARNGLAELEEAGWVCVDKRGRSYEYELAIDVPTSCYTYVPTALLDSAPGLGGTELRVVLLTLRDTWGWTFTPEDKEENEDAVPPEHRRWARLSTSEMARRTGRSETAVKKAAASLQGRFLERLRPTGGAYYYRFLPEAVRPTPAPEKSSEEDPRPGAAQIKKKRAATVDMPICDMPYGGIANDLTPPTRIERVSKRKKHSITRKRQTPKKDARLSRTGRMLCLEIPLLPPQKTPAKAPIDLQRAALPANALVTSPPRRNPQTRAPGKAATSTWSGSPSGSRRLERR